LRIGVSAFRKLALRYHPDRHAGVRPELFRDVSEAYDVLSDPVRRARYDRRLRRRGRGLIEVSLEGLGIRNLWLRVHVRVAMH
jgi:curved DNA-binding protein CbpA